MTDSLKTVLNQLRSQEKTMNSAYKKAKEESVRKKSQLNKIQKAIAMLDDDSEFAKPSRQTVTTSDVVEIVGRLVAENSVSVSSAREQVDEALKASNISRNGIALRFKQALSQFKVEGEIIYQPSKNENSVDSFGGT